MPHQIKRGNMIFPQLVKRLQHNAFFDQADNAFRYGCIFGRNLRIDFFCNHFDHIYTVDTIFFSPFFYGKIDAGNIEEVLF